MADKDGSGTDEDAFLTIGNKQLNFEVRQVPITELRYYEDNPRIYSLLASLSIAPTQESIEKELWKLAPTHDLFQLVKANGGLLEEVYVSDLSSTHHRQQALLD